MNCLSERTRKNGIKENEENNKLVGNDNNVLLHTLPIS